MKRLGLLVLLALFALSSCGATLHLAATAPGYDNDGTCAVPVLAAAPAGAARVVHWTWAGPVSGQDSVATLVGVLARLDVTVPPGTYTVHGWASGPGGIGCDTTVTRTVTAPPWRVLFQ